MRLLFVSHSLPPVGRPLANLGGMERVALELRNALRARPEVDLSVLELRASWRWLHLRVVPFLVKAGYRLWRKARRGEIDGVLFSSMVTAGLAWPLRRVLREEGVAAGAIAHGRDVTLPVAPYQWLVPHLFGALDGVFPVSRATGRACTARGLPPEKMQVIPNGIDTARFSPPPDRAAARRALLSALGAGALPEGATLLCSVGRQVKRKGFGWFAANVMPRFPEDVHYWLAGDGPEAGAIAEAARRAGVEQRVRLLGRVSELDLRRLYRGANLFVMPNIHVAGDMEGFGVVLLEAGLSGLPAVAARLEGIRDVISEGKNGHLIPSRDAEGFADVIRRYHRGALHADGGGRAAAAHVEKTFGWEAVARRYVEALRDARGEP